MADQYGLFWNSVSGDRTYDADSFSEWLGKFFTTGVFNGDLQVTPDSGMVVNVGSGYANINGKVRFFDTDTSITISPASGVYPRIDTIVVRADYTNREITLEYVTGSYSGNDPQPTAPTRNASMYEIVLAQILVSAGSTEVTAGSITDTRADDSVCGWVTSTVEGVPMDQIVSQMQAEFETWYDHMKDQLDEDAAGHLQLEIDSINSLITELRRIVDCHDGNMATVVSDTATEAISKGSYVMKNNGFRKVTSDIASGDPINSTNTEDTTIGAELQALNNGLNNIVTGEERSCTISLASTGWKTGEITTPSKTGYTLVGYLLRCNTYRITSTSYQISGANTTINAYVNSTQSSNGNVFAVPIFVKN